MIVELQSSRRFVSATVLTARAQSEVKRREAQWQLVSRDCFQGQSSDLLYCCIFTSAFMYKWIDLDAMYSTHTDTDIFIQSQT